MIRVTCINANHASHMTRVTRMARINVNESCESCESYDSHDSQWCESCELYDSQSANHLRITVSSIITPLFYFRLLLELLCFVGRDINLLMDIVISNTSNFKTLSTAKFHFLRIVLLPYGFFFESVTAKKSAKKKACYTINHRPILPRSINYIPVEKSI